MHPHRVTVWCRFWYSGIIGPFFFKNEQGATTQRIFVSKNWRGWHGRHSVSIEQVHLPHSQCNNRSFAHRFRKSNNQSKFWCQLAASELWFDPVGLFFVGESLRISLTLTIQRRLRCWNTKLKLPFMWLMKPKQSKMCWKIGFIEWGTLRSAVAVIWIM